MSVQGMGWVTNLVLFFLYRGEREGGRGGGVQLVFAVPRLLTMSVRFFILGSFFGFPLTVGVEY